MCARPWNSHGAACDTDLLQAISACSSILIMFPMNAASTLLPAVDPELRRCWLNGGLTEQQVGQLAERGLCSWSKVEEGEQRTRTGDNLVPMTLRFLKLRDFVAVRRMY